MTNAELRKYLNAVKGGRAVPMPSPASVAQRALKLLGEVERMHWAMQGVKLAALVRKVQRDER